MRSWSSVAVILFVSVVAPSLQGATTVVTNISTGVDPTTGQQLGNDVPDTAYAVVPGGNAGFVGQTLVAVSQSLPNTYVPDSASTASRWIGIFTGSGIQGITVPQGTYNLQTTVDLTGFDPSTASIPSSQFAVDDALAGIQINGTTIYTPPGGLATNMSNFASLPANLGLGDFTSGTNTITFDMLNAVQSPMALRFEGTVTAVQLPEPGSLALVTLGCLSIFIRRPSGRASRR